MPHDALAAAIDEAWEARATLSPAGSPGGDYAARAAVQAVQAALALLDAGTMRVAEPGPDGWVVHQWLKKAVLLSFRLNACAPMAGAGGAWAYDKVAMKTAGWDAEAFEAAGFRAVPGCVIRRPAYVAPGAVVMPSFINVGAHVGARTMVDAWATIGSCAQIGADCHISGGVGIGGVLEPLQADPVIIEDGCFIGARSEVAEGVIVERGSVLSMGVFLGASTRIVDRASGAVSYGRVPAWSVVVPGCLPGGVAPDGTALPGLACAVIVKRVDERTRAKTSINALLRD